MLKTPAFRILWDELRNPQIQEFPLWVLPSAYKIGPCVPRLTFQQAMVRSFEKSRGRSTCSRKLAVGKRMRNGPKVILMWSWIVLPCLCGLAAFSSEMLCKFCCFFSTLGI